MSSFIKVPWKSLLQFRAAAVSSPLLSRISPVFQFFFYFLVYLVLFPHVQQTGKAGPCSAPLIEHLALSPFIALLEFPQPAAPQVFPGDEQASLVCHYTTLAGGIVICAQEQVLPPWLDFGTFAGHILGTNPQQLVSTANAVLPLFVHWNDVDSELPPLSCFVPFQNMHLDSWGEKKSTQCLGAIVLFVAPEGLQRKTLVALDGAFDLQTLLWFLLKHGSFVKQVLFVRQVSTNEVFPSATVHKSLENYT